jgi:hypothetical protein
MAAPFPLPGGAPPLVEPLIPPQPLTLSGRAHRTGCSRWVGRPFHRPWSITGVDQTLSRELHREGTLQKAERGHQEAVESTFPNP